MDRVPHALPYSTNASEPVKNRDLAFNSDGKALVDHFLHPAAFIYGKIAG
jgi:hypothetical protein